MNCQAPHQFRKETEYEYAWKELNIYSANVRIDNYGETLLTHVEIVSCRGSGNFLLVGN
jgi:hypothetical protein